MWLGGKRVLMLGAVLIGAGCGDEKKRVADEIVQEESEPSKGRILYLVHCVSCHGKDGRLGLNSAKMLPDTKLGQAEIVQQITHGKGLMTAFEGLLSPAEIDSVALYVGRLKDGPLRVTPVQ